MSAWTHSICEGCYREREPGREPVRVVDTCCFCGKQHHDGIFYRGDPQTTACKGTGPMHQSED